MNTVKPTPDKKNGALKAGAKPGYRSVLRDEQAQFTKSKIGQALLALFETRGSADLITYKAVAEKAGVTEMTVYRHCPQRGDLLRLLWESINAKLGDQVAMPQTPAELLSFTPALHKGFGANAALIQASLTTSQGREMRASINEQRRQAFVGIVNQINRALPKKKASAYASILQLLHSAYAWDSLRSQWEMSDEEIAEITQDVLTLLIQHIKKEKP